MGGSVRVWRVWNFMTQTQPNPPSLKNQRNLAGWVESGRFWQVGGLATHPYLQLIFTSEAQLIFCPTNIFI